MLKETRYKKMCGSIFIKFKTIYTSNLRSGWWSTWGEGWGGAVKECLWVLIKFISLSGWQLHGGVQFVKIPESML